MNRPCCLLCNNPDTRLYFRDNTRSYWQCPACQLVFVPRKQHLSAMEERERYELHENNPDDRDYLSFLSKLADPLNKLLPPNSKGLDFGCGPGAALHLIFERQGHSMNLFDAFFKNEPSVFDQSYDFITATEVVEHLSKPQKELDRLWNCLRSGGYLGIMTGLVEAQSSFADWYYIRDETHIAFFSTTTFQWLARRWKASLDFFHDNVILLHKKA